MTTAAPDPLHEVESFIRRRASTDPEFAQFITALGRWLIQCSQAPSILVEPRPVAEPTLEIEPSRTPEPAFEQSTCELATLIARAPSDAAADADLKGLCDRFNGEVSPRLAPAAGARVVQHAAPPLDRFAALEPMM
ncbi:MAG: hypothetical protein EXS03_04035, partial [Phycisphaerales bacterium]|nr:hypothetical protein [Phycisphaerales bacterium]